MDSYTVPAVALSAPGAENAVLRAQILNAVAKVIDSGSYILGREVSTFEAEMADSLGVAGVAGVGSGTDAIVVALVALGVGKGDEIIIPSHTAGPTCAAVALTGATPVLIDVDPATYVITADLVAAAITPRTKAVIPVHLYGFPVDMEAVLRVTEAAGIAVLEDCAQSQGAMIGNRQVGSFGALSCFSFYPTKNLGALGDGGAVAAQNTDLYRRVRSLRTYGWINPQYAELPGGQCSRLDEIQAAILRIKLARLTATNARRAAVANRYGKAFDGLPIQLPPMKQGFVHGFHLYVIRTSRRDRLVRFLKERGIGTGLHYPFAVHQQPAFQSIARIPFPLLETEALVPEIVSLPLHPELTDRELDHIINSVCEFFA